MYGIGATLPLRGVPYLSGVAFAQLGLEDLAVIVLGQLVDEPILLRPLEAGDVLEAKPIEGLGAAPSLRPTTKATTRSPHSASGTPTTETSTTSGWRCSTSSISRG